MVFNNNGLEMGFAWIIGLLLIALLLWLIIAIQSANLRITGKEAAKEEGIKKHAKSKLNK